MSYKAPLKDMLFVMNEVAGLADINLLPGCSDAAPETVHWGFFDAALKPLLTVESGETVTISTVSGMANQMPPSPYVIPKALPAIHANLQQSSTSHSTWGVASPLDGMSYPAASANHGRSRSNGTIASASRRA